MNTTTIKTMDYFRYADSVQLLIKWSKAYYKGSATCEDGTIVPQDGDFDKLYREVQQFERENPTMVDKESPTHKIITDAQDGFQKVDHKYPMLSIANSNGYEELEEWVRKTEVQGVNEFDVEFKIDGLALSLIYEHGRLTDAVTRGNGVCGDRVLANVLQIKSIPRQLAADFTGEIRGECVWFLKDFEAFQLALEKEGKQPMANPRNGAAGSLKQKDPTEVARRNLNFIAYSVVSGSNRPKQSDDLAVLRSHGFFVSDHYVVNGVSEVMRTAKSMEAKRNSLSFLTDGLVIKTNDKNLQEGLGGSSKTPHFLTALKFPPEEKEAVTVKIERSYGRTGAVTPVVIIEPTKLAGTTVQRASLHNWDILEFLGLHDGCKVVVRKSGEIIPEIVSVVGIGRTKTDYSLFIDKNKGDRHALMVEIELLRKHYPNYKFVNRPIVCDNCGSKLANAENRSGDILVALECQNSSCSIKQFKNIVRFCEKEAMNLVGISEQTIEDLLSYKLITNVTDLYSLTKDDILKMAGYGDRSAEIIVDSIEKSKKNYLHQLLVGFGIPNCGKTLSDKLATQYEELEVVASLTKAQLLTMGDIGDETAETVSKFFKDNTGLVNFFLKTEIAVKTKPGIKKLSDKLTGMTLIFTGTSDNLSRQFFKDVVPLHGGKLVSSVSKKLTHIVAGQSPGPDKMQKIQDLNRIGAKIKIIDDETFLAMIK